MSVRFHCPNCKQALGRLGRKARRGEKRVDAPQLMAHVERCRATNTHLHKAPPVPVPESA